ncbi:hypothetical protein [Dokdonella soli]|uniref:Uncharacterized protein n=1 Tax=Dokdonella soli TaxID=529810 RepID=A0ABN1IDD0_9GAMM
MGHQNKPQTSPQKHAPMHSPDQKMPGQHDDKHRHSQGNQPNDPNRTNPNPGMKNPGRDDR